MLKFKIEPQKTRHRCEDNADSVRFDIWYWHSTAQKRLSNGEKWACKQVSSYGHTIWCLAYCFHFHFPKSKPCLTISFSTQVIFRGGKVCEDRWGHVCVCYCTCQDTKLIDWPLSSDVEEHWSIRRLPVGLVYKEPLEERQGERSRERERKRNVLFRFTQTGSTFIVLM